MHKLMCIAVVACFWCPANSLAEDSAKAKSDKAGPQGVLDFEVETIDGKKVKLDEYEGDVLLIVNVASKCGLTDRNYKKLEPLYEEYKDKGLRILAFPANNFGGQEPGTHAEIKQFCAKYDVSFDLFAKVSVQGKDCCPLYKFLIEHPDKEIGGPVQWNFQKYLVGRDGKVLEKFSPRVDPDSEDLRNAIEQALAVEAEKSDADNS